MTAADAKARLAVMTAAASDPVLSDSDLDLLVEVARRPDPDGVLPTQDGWTPTYALGAAAAEGWTWKAGRVADRTDMQGDDTAVKRSQLFEHCTLMADRYRRQAWTAAPLTATGGRRVEGARLLGQDALLPGAQGPVHVGPPYRAAFALPGAVERGDSAA